MDRFTCNYYPVVRNFFDFQPWNFYPPRDYTCRWDIDPSERRLAIEDALSDRDQFGFKNSHLSLGLHPEIVNVADAQKYYRLSMHMGNNFDQEKVNVFVKDRVVTVEAKKEQQSDENGDAHFYHEVKRKFTMPSNVNMEEVRCSLSADGLLKIAAPLPKQALPELPKVTNILVHFH